ncbi:MAG: response regulator [Bacteroidota bacterium]
MPQKKPQPRYPTVMLIDDNEIDNFINQKMMEGCNFAEQIYIHTSSRSALEFLDNFARADNIPDKILPEIIFLDINMPIMDGFQFVEEFRKRPAHIKEKCRIVMLTTSIDPTDQKQCDKNDLIEKFISKPLTEEHLEEM